MRNAWCILALAALGFSCKEDDEELTGVSDTIRVFAWPEHPLPSQETLDVVAETYGMEVVVSDGWLGSIALYYTEFVAEAGAEGIATGPTCSPHIAMRASADRIVLAHEIGHTLGLNHVDTPKNLMNVDDPDFNLEESQLETVRMYAWELEQCRK